MTSNRLIETRRFAGLALGLLVGSAAGGQASATVTTSAAAGNGQINLCSGGYSGGGSGGSFVVAGAQTPCSFSVNSQGTVGTGAQSATFGTAPDDLTTINAQYQGTVDPHGKPLGSATSAFDQEGTVITTTNPDPRFDTFSSSASFAAANLKDGTVHASAVSNSLGDANASALESDNLHFTVAGATASTVTDITAQFTLDGNFGAASVGTASMLWETGLGSNGLAIAYEGVGGGAFQNATLEKFGNINILKNTANEIVYDSTFEIDGSSANALVAQNIFLHADSGWALNYQNTGTIKLILPANVTYTSDSGVFLTGGAVPEPATWAVMLVGFGGMGAAMRRSRRQRLAALSA